ncbi:hypothetical protein B296_00031738 [Ensete ventricosum]|uniref:Uncharacterized protein n=1 Tax=Ensete ventricosum TaxID=4639 RepID=A0A427AFF9_ENSVE|nr:hypothetical protein B296_00031738 [Ensete ventricosum]
MIRASERATDLVGGADAEVIRELRLLQVLATVFTLKPNHPFPSSLCSVLPSGGPSRSPSSSSPLGQFYSTSLSQEILAADE